MIGINTIELNESTAKEAIQHWLNTTQLKTPVVVTSVNRTSDRGLTIVVRPVEDEEAS